MSRFKQCIGLHRSHLQYIERSPAEVTSVTQTLIRCLALASRPFVVCRPDGQGTTSFNRSKHQRSCARLHTTPQYRHGNSQTRTNVFMDQELADDAAHAPGRRYMCTHQMAALFCVKRRHGRHLESMTSCQKSDPVNRRIYEPEEESCQLWSISDSRWIKLIIWNDGALGFFEDGRPNKNNNKKRWIAI